MIQNEISYELYAKNKLHESRSMLDLAYDVGLSFPSRLHDLFVSFEAMTPGEYKKHGKLLTIYYGIHPSTFGKCLVAMTDRGICGLSFVDDNDTEVINELQARWPLSKLEKDNERTKDIIDLLFRNEHALTDKPITLFLKGTNFQIQVWRALMTIPEGNLLAYKDIASLIGKSSASRAVGTAIGKNPIAYLIPCHRVIRENGELGQYHWGQKRKIAMIGKEAVQKECAI